MELLFISPRWEKFPHWPFHMPLLGPLTVAGLTPGAHAITYLDENVEPIDFTLQPDAVIISAMTVQAQRGYEIAAEFTRCGIPVIMGGLHSTLLPDEVQSKVTSVVAGEAELVWPTIVRDLEVGTLQPLYTAQGTVNFDCGIYGLPRRDLLKSVGYTKTPSGQRVFDTIQAGRGCVRNCPDCTVPLISGRRFRPRRLDDVLREIESITSRFMFFVDDSIPECRDYFMTLFRAMKGMGKNWMSVGALHVVNDQEFLQAIVDSGCKVFYIGFDRLNPAWRVQEGKKAAHDLYRLDLKKHDVQFTNDFLTDPKPYYEAITRLKEMGISLIGTFAFGYDKDDPTIFEACIEFALQSAIDLADFAILVPYPRSPLALTLERQKRILTHDWKLYNGMHVVFQPARMSPEQLAEGTEWAWQQWTKRRPIYRNMIRVFGEPNPTRSSQL